MFKNVASKIAVFAFDTTTGAAKTGDAANLTVYVSKDYGAVTVLADSSATEMDATKAPGWYLFDLAQAETNADSLLFTGKSTTANISVVGREIFTTPNRFTTLVIDAAGLADANAVKVGPSGAGTAQTAGDVYALETTIAGYIDTEVAAIKAKTDLIPASPASTTNITAASGVTLSATGSAALTESYAADGAAPTLNQMLYQILQFLHEKNISGTTMTVKKLDGATTAMTFTLDSATSPTSLTRAT